MNRLKIYSKTLLAILTISSLVFINVHHAKAQDLLTKENAVQSVLEKNHGIIVAQNNARIAENNTQKANNGYYPTVALQGSGNYGRANSKTIYNIPLPDNITSGSNTINYNASLAANYTIYDGKGRAYNFDRFKEAHELSLLEVRRIIENSTFQLLNAYYNIVNLKETLNINSEALAISRRRLKRAQYRNDYGKANRLEVLNAQVDINRDSVNFLSVNELFNNAKRNLNFLIDRNVDADFEVENQVIFNENLNLETLLENAMNNNVQLMQIDRNINMSMLDLKINDSRRLPTVGAQATYGFNGAQNDANHALDYQNGNNLSLGLNLSWSIYDGGLRNVRAQNAKIGIENNQILKEQQALNIETTIRNLWNSYQNALFILKVEENNVSTSRLNFERTEDQYNIGQVSSVEFRQAQLNLLNAELSLNQAKYSAKVIELELLQHAGQLLEAQY